MCNFIFFKSCYFSVTYEVIETYKENVMTNVKHTKCCVTDVCCWFQTEAILMLVYCFIVCSQSYRIKRGQTVFS